MVPEDFKYGMLVTYVPNLAKSNYCHSKRELGVAKSIKGKYVAVKSLKDGKIKNVFLSRVFLGDLTFPCRKEWKGGFDNRCSYVCDNCKKDNFPEEVKTLRHYNVENKKYLLKRRIFSERNSPIDEKEHSKSYRRIKKIDEK